MGFSPTRTLTALALLLALPLGAQGLGQRRMDLPARENPALEGSEPDRPDLRRDWNLWWFGGKPSPAYLDYKNRLAVQEMRRWGRLLPQASGAKPLPAFVGTASAPTGTGGMWMNLGPMANSTNSSYPDIDSGRPSAIAVDPGSNTLYLAASGGGVWKCANADPNSTSDWTWTPITDGLPNSGSSGNVSVGALALSPTNAQVLYLGLGDAFDAEGRGFYKSIDGGSNWTQSTGGGNQTISFFILPVDANVVLWGTNDGLKRSTDGGNTFAPVTSGPTSGNIWSIQAFSATELACSVSSGSVGNDTSGTLYFSSDAGATWTPATTSGLGTITPGRMTLAAVPNGTAAYGEVEDTTASLVARGVLVTSDKGHTWTWQAAATETNGLFQSTDKYMTTDAGQAWYNHAIAVDPTNSQRLIMGANLAMYRSTNGGLNWQQLTNWAAYGHVYSHADFHAITTKGGMFYVGNDGGLSIFKSPWGTIPTGAGTSSLLSNTAFVDNTRNKGLTTHLVYNVGSTLATNVPDGKYRISLGMQDNGTRLRQPNTPGGTLTGTETTFDDMIGGDGFATLMHPSDGMQVLGSLYYTDIYKSTDGGGSFSESITGLTGAGNKSSAPFQPRLAFGNQSSPGTVYTATNYTVFKSTDFGSTWAALPTTGLSSTKLIHNLGAAGNDPQALGVVTDGGLAYLSYNGGSSWVQRGPFPNNALATSYVWFDRTNSSIVYAASVALSATANHLWKSTDQGQSWQALDGSAGTSNGFPFGIPVHVVETDPINGYKIYAGTDFGVYFSTDGGSTWSRFGSNMPMVAVRDLYVAPDGSFIRAATFGRGVWELQVTVGPSVTLDKATVTLNPSATTSFTATVANFVSDNKVNWTTSTGGGSVNPAQTASGTATTYTAPTLAGIYTLKAASNETPSAMATATVGVYNPASVTVSVSPATKTLVTGASFTFAATVTNAPDNTVTWSAIGGSVTSTGAYTAPSAPGTYTVTATSTWAGTNPGTATVIVKTLDLNGDGIVDQRDLLFFAKYYGTANAACDLNGDGIVNDKDLGILLGGL